MSMKNYLGFEKIMNEEEREVERNGEVINEMITTSKTVLVGRVKAVRTGTTKAGRPYGQIILSSGAEKYDITADGIIKSECEREEDGTPKPIFVNFYNSMKARGNKAYDDFLRLTTASEEGKSPVVRENSIVMLKCTQQVITYPDDSNFVSYLAIKMYINGICELQENDVPCAYLLMGTAILTQKQGDYRLSIPTTMQNPITGAWDVKTYINCIPATEDGKFTDEMVKSLAKHGDKFTRTVLVSDDAKYNLETSDPLNPEADFTFKSWMTIPEFEEGELKNGNGDIVVVD